jgi:hypothetical protein
MDLQAELLKFFQSFRDFRQNPTYVAIAGSLTAFFANRQINKESHD